ncbi:hypothetical protein ACEE65_11235, partial [Streptococcus pluranimalium]
GYKGQVFREGVTEKKKEWPKGQEGTPNEVSKSAKLPATPKTNRNLLLGFVVGLMLSIIAS